MLSGGSLLVEPGGAATNTNIFAGGNEYLYGNETSATVDSGGELTVSSGGIALGVTVSSGGGENVSAAGSDNRHADTLAERWRRGHIRCGQIVF